MDAREIADEPAALRDLEQAAADAVDDAALGEEILVEARGEVRVLQPVARVLALPEAGPCVKQLAAAAGLRHVAEARRVVVMAVRAYSEVRRRKVRAETARVRHRRRALPAVEKKAPSARLDPVRKAVLRAQREILRPRVVHEGKNFNQSKCASVQP